MTVSTQVSRNEYTGNGATTQYDFTFRILDKSHLLVQTLDTSESIVTLTLGTDYTVTGVNRYNGGKVVLTSALPAGYKISIERSTPVTQEASIRNQGGFFPEIHEDAFDKLTMLLQQMFGWWTGLALKKPSWLANYYDALNNRIRNLRDPSEAQDAATKSYADGLYDGAISHSDAQFKRTLRVPESSVVVIPGVAARKNHILAFNSAGNPITVLPESGSAADVLIDLGSSEALLGAYLVARKNGGRVQNAISAYYVDDYGSDPTGAVDSTAAVLAALAEINGKTVSDYDGTVSTYAEVVFGNGTYMVGDVPFVSGIRYRGQGRFATRIKPLAGASYCFSVNLQGTNRIFYAGLEGMTIGSGYQNKTAANYEYPPVGVGGVHIEDASFFTLRDVAFRYLDGGGVALDNVWDSDFYDLRILDCGDNRAASTPLPGLRIGPGSSTDDGSNALRFFGLHVEMCKKLLDIDKRSRHIFFVTPKLEAQESDAIPSTIRGARGISFVSPELTWGRNNEFMFDMFTTGDDDNQLVAFNDPVLISSLSAIGNYFKHQSSLGPLVISNAQMRGVRQLAYGSNIHVSGGSAWESGPVLIDGLANITIDGVDWRGITQPSGTSAPAISVNGPGCRLTNNKFNFGGTSSDGLVGVYIGASSTDALVTNNLFSGARATAISIAAAAVTGCVQYGNRIVDGGSFTALVSGSSPAAPVLYRGNSPQKFPVVFPDAVTLAPSATYSFSGLTGASLLMVAASWTFSSVSYSESALVLMNNSATVVNVISSLRGMILDGTAGMAAAKIYITKSGSTYTVTNKYTETVTIKIVSINI